MEYPAKIRIQIVKIAKVEKNKKKNYLLQNFICIKFSNLYIYIKGLIQISEKSFYFVLNYNILEYAIIPMDYSTNDIGYNFIISINIFFPN